MRSGQALVEFALVVPILLFAFLGMAEAGFAFAASHSWQRGAEVLADAAAIRVAADPAEAWRAGWQVIAEDERRKVGCQDPEVSFPDGQDAGDRVVVTWRCAYTPILAAGIFPTIDATVDAAAVIPSE